jgi:putative N6-adenine-specific DNA methylase
VAERIARAIAHRVAIDAQPAEGIPRQLVVVRIVHDTCTISVDASGELLHRRGYRHATAKAPLRETLAAALLLTSGWDGVAPLIDPMCGAGTIAIEAALLARHRAPGLGRSFAFERWPEFDRETWATTLTAARARERPHTGVVIHASDRDAGATAAAQANAERASVAGAIDITTRPISAITPPPGPGWLVTNPPYGVRVGDRDRLRNLYAQLGNVVRAKCAGWTVAFLSADRTLTRQTQLPLTPHLRTTNGGIPIEAVVGRVPG